MFRAILLADSISSIHEFINKQYFQILRANILVIELIPWKNPGNHGKHGNHFRGFHETMETMCGFHA